MDLHLGQSEAGEFYLVIGCRVGLLLNESTFTEPENSYLGEGWLIPGISRRRGKRHSVNG
jgi:hypothetical protein